MSLPPPDRRTRWQRLVDRWCVRFGWRQPYGGKPRPPMPANDNDSGTVTFKRDVAP